MVAFLRNGLRSGITVLFLVNPMIHLLCNKSCGKSLTGRTHSTIVRLSRVSGTRMSDTRDRFFLRDICYNRTWKFSAIFFLCRRILFYLKKNVKLACQKEKRCVNFNSAALDSDSLCQRLGTIRIAFVQVSKLIIFDATNHLNFKISNLNR